VAITVSLDDLPLAEALEREGAGWALERCAGFAAELAGGPREWGRLANENPPRLRRDEIVEFHPAWHALLGLSLDHGVHSLSWTEPREGAQVARAALVYLASQNEAGHGCPVSMTHAAVPALRAAAPRLAAEWEPRLTARTLCGMAMTERQGGSDVRANTTEARPIGDDEYTLHGAKWFCSAPMSDAFLVLAQAPGGLSCFLMPRGEGFHIERLKDKLGDRSNASSEIELRGAWARLVGEEGGGVRAIVEMVVHTRLDCVLGTAAGMRTAVQQATLHCAQRSAFGKLLVDQPLMRNVLADLCIESEAASVTAFRLARAYDRRAGDAREAAFARIATAIAKYWICKRGPAHAAEALECLGGNGYIEESIMPRVYRQQPLQSIWEGSGNVVCLDVLRALRREPDAAAVLLDEIRLAGEPALDASAEQALGEADEAGARRAVEALALALQGSLLIRHAPPAVAAAFLGRDRMAYGALPAGSDWASIIDRHKPIQEDGA
jgi:putative acyl-CoA dehydrogenase